MATQSGHRPGFGYRPDGNRVATSSVRTAAVADGLPERGEPAAPLLVFNSYAAGVGVATGACCRPLQTQDGDCEAGWTAPPGEPDG